jgi:hypothetical protein
MTDADLDFLLKVLIMKNTPASLADRCMFTFQWQAIGRVMEIAKLRLLNMGCKSNRSLHIMNVSIVAHTLYESTTYFI